MSAIPDVHGRPENDTDPADRRDSARVKSLLRGCIYFNDRSAAADCLVRDISDTGARLELSETVVIPYLVDLYIPKREETLRASVQWRHGDLVGIAFIGPGDAGDPKALVRQGQHDAALAGRVQQLEDEVAALKRSVGILLAASTSRLPV
jgi:hypothetical protein